MNAGVFHVHVGEEGFPEPFKMIVLIGRASHLLSKARRPKRLGVPVVTVPAH